jgi:hypothetical protein
LDVLNIATGEINMVQHLRITVVMIHLLTCLWVHPSHAANGDRLKVALANIAVTGQVVSKADAATLTDRFWAEMERSSAFKVVAVPEADLTITAGISRQDTTYILRVELQCIKNKKSKTVEARYGTSSDLISAFTKGFPGLVSNRLELTARELLYKTNKAVYAVLGAVAAGGGGTAFALMRGRGGGSAPPPPPGPGSISFTITVP